MQETLKGDFVLLRAGTLRLLLPQREVGAARYHAEGTQRDLVALSDDGRRLPQCPSGRFVSTELEGVPDVAWCWDELRVLIGVTLAAFELPRALLGAGTPVDRYVEIDGQVVFPCTAARIAAFAFSEAPA